MPRHIQFGLLVLAFLSSSAFAQISVKLDPVETGAMEKLGYYFPQKIDLSPTAPPEITKAPADLHSPLYGVMNFALGNGKSKVAVIIDTPSGQPARLFIDSNGNGDLTDDPPVTWRQDSRDIYQGEAQLPLSTSDHPFTAGVHFYWFYNDPQQPQLRNALAYYRDYARIGRITLGGKTFAAALVNERCDGGFAASQNPVNTTSPVPGVVLFIDTNQDGKFDTDPSERFFVHNPFNIGGVTYEVANLTNDGRFDVIKSTQTVPEIKPLPNLSTGHVAPAFTAQLLDGSTVHFPTDYKGKIVLIDFWATWCGPCMGEVPGVVAAYQKLHSKGLEILGITFDQPNSLDKLNQTMKSHNMTWPQIYEGKGWKTTLGAAYGIHSIPHPLLIDGDTGKIIEGAQKNLRGALLEPTLEAALRTKFGAEASAAH